MNIADADAQDPHNPRQARGPGIPLIALVGLPLVLLLFLVFLGIGWVVQTERTNQSRIYSERTAEILAGDIAGQLGQLISPTSDYVEALRAEIKSASCRTAACVFAIVKNHAAAPDTIPPEAAYVAFGAESGQFFGIFKINAHDDKLLGRAQTDANDPTRLDLISPTNTVTVKPYILHDRGWYQGGGIRQEPIWSAPFKYVAPGNAPEMLGAWAMSRIVRVDDPDGKLLGVITADVDLRPIGAFLQQMTGKAFANLSIHTRSGEFIVFRDGQLQVISDDSSAAKIEDGLISKEVALPMSDLKGWSLTLTLGPELSKPALWGPSTPLLLMVGLLASLAVAAYTASYVANPVKRLSRAVVEVSNLKLDTPVNVETNVTEIAALAGAVERMRAALRRNQNRLEFLAYHDPATGLLNRAGLSNEYSGMIARSGQIELVLIKIPNYTHIGGVFGGTALANIIARNVARIRNEYPDSIVGNVSEHETAFLACTASGLDHLQLDNLLKSLREPYEQAGIRCAVEIVASVSIKQSEQTDFDLLLRRANGALHYAEKTQSEGAIWYNPALLHDLEEELDATGNVALAIMGGEFSVEFQAIAELKTRLIDSVQVFGVWNHPQLGAIRQKEFFSIFEKNGSIRDVGLYIIGEAFKFLRTFKTLHPQAPMVVCINLSQVQLFDPLFVERVTELQREWDVDGADVMFVIVRNASSLEDAQIVRTLDKLQTLRFRLAVDYFGLDNASLAAMTAVKSECLIAGPSLHRNIDRPGRERTLLRAICRLAADLGMYTAAVGVNNAADIEPLIECGCTYGMGPLFGRAVSAEAFLDNFVKKAVELRQHMGHGSHS